MRGIALVGLLALVAVPRGAGSAAPPVLALEDGSLDRPSRIVALDPRTLEPLRRGPSLPGFAFGLAYARSPDGRTVALLPRPADTADHLFLVDRATLQIVGHVALGGTACAFAWPAPSHLLALVSDDACYRPSRLSVVAVDPASGALTRIGRTGIRSVVLPSTATIGGGVAVVTVASGRARLLVVTVRGLDEIGLPGRVSVGDTVALGASAGHVFVARANWTVADVSLARHKVTTHRLRLPRVTASATKGPTGLVISTATAGGRLLALAGGTVDRRTGSFATRGAWLVDSTTWRMRRIDRHAGAVAAAPGLMLVFDGPWDQVSNQSAGLGVAAYTSSGRLRYRALPGARIASVRVEGPYIYAVDGIGDGQAFAVASGRQTGYDIAGGVMASLLVGPRGP
jgi:hypothetical protein